MSVVDGGKSGKALKYKYNANTYGTYYIQWVDVKPNTDYSFAFDVKILEGGMGKLMVLQDKMSRPEPILGFEFAKDIYGGDWGSYYIKFNSGVYTRVGIAVCNLGGEALMDNLRLFKSADGTPPAEGGTVATIAPNATTTTTTKKPTTTTTTAPVIDDDGAGDTTTVTDPDVTEDTTLSDETTTTTLAADVADTPVDGDDTSEPAPRKWLLWVGVGAGAVAAIAAVAILLLVMKKKKA